MVALNTFHSTTGLKANIHKSQMAIGGAPTEVHNHCLQLTGLQETQFPLKYLGVPITASRLTKIECSTLIEKITAMKYFICWRALLINSVIFGAFNYWASIFLLPHELLEKLTQLCKNYLWTISAEFKRVPYISWNSTCMPKGNGGLGLKDFFAWNKATIAKLIWAIAKKKDIKIGGIILPLMILAGTGRRCVQSKKSSKKDALLLENGTRKEIKEGYEWQQQAEGRVPWGKIIWARTIIPRHTYTAWMLAHQKLPTRLRLNRHMPQNTSLCELCQMEEENEQRLFFECQVAKSVWIELQNWWPITLPPTDVERIFSYLVKLKGPKRYKLITYAVFCVGIYHIWFARNQAIFKYHKIPSQ
ncbi:hypothetical protein Cgig2_013946 [Carnegiea gigantea]|uniref:Reverse transcriptase zinc-binding domain-containing protein n=1 Tax=Carnegiea gigantea TaxID=171969 RepID=A0A9Q1KWW9_9CARY|nr:hypothetical protein Cgig2_013946 [Carnegiea gigantea]